MRPPIALKSRLYENSCSRKKDQSAKRRRLLGRITAIAECKTAEEINTQIWKRRN
jgi:hypothetical protein